MLKRALGKENRVYNAGRRRPLDFELNFFVFFWRKPTNGSAVSGKKIDSRMRSCRSGMRLPSPRRRLGSLFPGPQPLILPFPAEILRLNWLQRSRKVFWKL